ncbi:MAG: hypothetical protein J2P17_30430, partial [Mycobacterium sp.]|nr:hypothetical protein [Mycobacterium sp.]
MAHDAASRQQLRAEGGVWASADLTTLTHHVDNATLPVDRSMLLTVKGTRGGNDVVVAQHFHIPSQASVAAGQVAAGVSGSPAGAVAAKQLQRLGLTAAAVRTPSDVAQLDSLIDSYTTAAAIVSCHPSVATVDPTSAKATTNLLNDTPSVADLGSYIDVMQNQKGEDWATLQTAVDNTGKAWPIKVGDQTTTFQTIVLNSSDPNFHSAARRAVSDGIVGVRDTTSLGAVITEPLENNPEVSPGVPAATRTWIQSQGVVPVSTAYSPSQASSAVHVKIKRPGTVFGTQVKPAGTFDPAQMTLPLRFYNNFVRWVDVYVQYIGANGANLSFNANPTGRDTKYAQHLGMLPQVFTVLGIPIWDTNHIEATLKFPNGAHTARLLMCGLGSNILDGGWRQYFPSDAYPDTIAPTGEVLAASLMTGIVTIGLTVISLVSDTAVAGSWQAARTSLDDVELPTDFDEALQVLSQWLVGAETVGTAVVRGAATYTYLHDNGIDTFQNLWGLLVAFAGVIPKILFSASYQNKLILTIGAQIVAA